MSNAWGHVIGGFTIATMLSFVGIWLWAWLPYHKRDFDRLARLPMDEGTNAATDEAEQA